MNKELLFGDEARRKIKVGVDKLADAVKVTLGARGRNVIMSREFTSPLITKDGVTVAKEITLKDNFENIGASLIKEAAQKTNDIAGDGTTTATVLAQAIIDAGMRHIRSGHNPIEVKRGIDKAVSQAITKLKEISKPITTSAEIAQVGAISANDTEIGELIARAMDEVGKNGVITVENSNKLGLTLDVVKGMKIDKGYTSQYMVTNKEKQTSEITEPYILITNQKLNTMNQLVPILKLLIDTGIKDLLIIAEDYSDDVISALVVNRLRGSFNALCIKTPGFGENKEDYLADILALTGATLISQESTQLSNVQILHLGRAGKVSSTKDETTLIDGRGEVGKVQEVVRTLNQRIEDSDSEYDKARFKERIARLSGGVAVIKVGAPSDVEIKEIKDRIEDALNATRAAVEEGIVTGGGVALLIASESINVECDNKDQQVGLEIIKESLQVPIKQIAINAGLSGDVVISIVKASKFKKGYNAHTGEYEDLLKAGVIDPTKVTRTALEKSASVASMFLTTECVITDEIEEEILNLRQSVDDQIKKTVWRNIKNGNPISASDQMKVLFRESLNNMLEKLNPTDPLLTMANKKMSLAFEVRNLAALKQVILKEGRIPNTTEAMGWMKAILAKTFLAAPIQSTIGSGILNMSKDPAIGGIRNILTQQGAKAIGEYGNTPVDLNSTGFVPEQGSQNTRNTQNTQNQGVDLSKYGFVPTE